VDPYANVTVFFAAADTFLHHAFLNSAYEWVLDNGYIPTEAVSLKSIFRYLPLWPLPSSHPITLSKVVRYLHDGGRLLPC
jgi:hypothetical protein